MRSVTYQGRTLFVNAKSFFLPYEIRDAFILQGKIVVLADPNSFLNDPSYCKERRRGINPFKNLLALSFDGSIIWEAEFPENVDYYYSISSKQPLVVNSFSSFKCNIDIDTGEIIAKQFYK
ncbi:MAG: hypothetical protein U1E09_05065 [Methylococcales bacterium]|nr:hypothetical protein [Methylococcaceae bacterium]MDP3391571.1 hypothetical protein [Methylococcaceae bacterium]MDZ4155900.1 hypothetical protein [Methylococcales bacterium]